MTYAYVVVNRNTSGTRNIFTYIRIFVIIYINIRTTLIAIFCITILYQDGEKMIKPRIFRKKIIIFVLFLLLLVLFNHIYYQLLSPYIGLWLIITVEIAWNGFGLFLFHKWYKEISWKAVKIIEENSTDKNFSREVSRIISKDTFHADIIKIIVDYQNKQQEEHQRLLDRLTQSNTLLQRNNKITDSIMQITSEILASGEIDRIMQTILDKAIEIIPNAQKGSILIYNGCNLEFRATHGYAPEDLKDVTLEIEELFQYYLPDFYEPCIVNDPESFNKKHMSGDKFESLRQNEVFDLKSVLSCAIQIDNEFYGVINLDITEGTELFRKEDMPLIKHLAAQIGIALKNAGLIEKIFYLSRHDSLTGIYNRCSFEEQLMRIYQQSRTSGQVFTLVILDINDLKKVNDTYGHEAGDLLLKIFSKVVNSRLEADDIFARYGGDEFALIFPDKTSEQSEAEIKAIMTVFSEAPLMYCGKRIANISFSFGMTEFPADTNDFNELIKLSDARMYKNKEETKKPIFS